MLGIPLSSRSAPPPQASQKMSSSWSFVPPTLQSSFLLPRPQLSPSFHPNFKWNRLSIRKNKLQAPRCVSPKTQSSQLDKFALLLQYGAILAAVEAPSALAVTGNNTEEDLVTTLISGGIVAVFYLFVIPPIIMNWLRLRWYKRKFFETYLQFMCVFIFFPGLMLWAPFLNFRKFPRDPTMEYPWSTPKDDVPLYKSR
ncbi:NAD(P)H-quinone oxidoreductase subunit L, chloroplastic isoform X1 [Musa acuminata AAA Group]|uniref:NAD(P)H-quinone oxidoreductase subunit L, chloroplastic isoform X1 n=1 Tax=Musa acuminata AAA Group TaxID=214697 RepID=UPI0031D8A310